LRLSKIAELAPCRRPEDVAKYGLDVNAVSVRTVKYGRLTVPKRTRGSMIRAHADPPGLLRARRERPRGRRAAE
jgi:hypothetical protein